MRPLLVLSAIGVGLLGGCSDDDRPATSPTSPETTQAPTPAPTSEETTTLDTIGTAPGSRCADFGARGFLGSGQRGSTGAIVFFSKLTRDVGGSVAMISDHRVARLLPDRTWDASVKRDVLVGDPVAMTALVGGGWAVVESDVLDVFAADGSLKSQTRHNLKPVTIASAPDGSIVVGGSKLDSRAIPAKDLPTVVRVDSTGVGASSGFTEVVLSPDEAPRVSDLFVRADGSVVYLAGGHVRAIDPAGKPTTLQHDFAPGRRLELAPLPDGGAVVAGVDPLDRERRDDLPVGFALARIDANGFRDTTFGGAGISFVEIASAGYSDSVRSTLEISGVVAQPDGKILVLGSLLVTGKGSTRSQAVLVRVDAKGQRDASFGSNGVLRTGLDGDASYAHDLALLGNDRAIFTAVRTEKGISEHGIVCAKLAE